MVKIENKQTIELMNGDKPLDFVGMISILNSAKLSVKAETLENFRKAERIQEAVKDFEENGKSEMFELENGDFEYIISVVDGLGDKQAWKEIFPNPFAAAKGIVHFVDSMDEVRKESKK